jgi:hypothetical protein
MQRQLSPDVGFGDGDAGDGGLRAGRAASTLPFAGALPDALDVNVGGVPKHGRADRASFLAGRTPGKARLGVSQGCSVDQVCVNACAVQ